MLFFTIHKYGKLCVFSPFTVSVDVPSIFEIEKDNITLLCSAYMLVTLKKRLIKKNENIAGGSTAFYVKDQIG